MTWLGKAAVLWVLREAPDVPPHLLAALIAVAAHAGEDGTAAYPSASTVAAIIRKSERGAKKDLAELRELGLLLPGDQDAAKDIRADRRPFVYDLPMPRGVAPDTPSLPRGEPQFRTGCPTVPHGVNHSSPEEILNRSRNSARRNAAAPRASQQPAPPPASELCRRCGQHGHAREDCTL